MRIPNWLIRLTLWRIKFATWWQRLWRKKHTAIKPTGSVSMIATSNQGIEPYMWTPGRAYHKRIIWKDIRKMDESETKEMANLVGLTDEERQKRLISKIMAASDAIQRHVNRPGATDTFIVTRTLLDNIKMIHGYKTDEEGMNHIREVLEGRNVQFNEALAKHLDLE